MLGQSYYVKTNKKQKEALNVAVRSADRLDKIIVDLLEVSRIEAGSVWRGGGRINIFLLEITIHGYASNSVHHSISSLNFSL